MAHAFDTGLAKPQRTLLVEGIATALAPLRVAGGMYLKAIKTLARVVQPTVRQTDDVYGIYLAVNASQGNDPCVLIALGDEDVVGLNTEALEMESTLDVQVLVCSSNMRSREVGRLSSDIVADTDPMADPGIWVMLEHVRERLAGQAIGVGHEMRLKHVREVATFDDRSFWELRFDVAMDVIVDPDRDVGDLDSIEADNELDGIPPGGPLDPLVTTITDLDDPEDP